MAEPSVAPHMGLVVWGIWRAIFTVDLTADVKPGSAVAGSGAVVALAVEAAASGVVTVAEAVAGVSRSV
jgi:hypothetical protein